MPEIKIIKKGWKCLRCEHEWTPQKGFDKKKIPITCPKCKSPYWNVPKRGKK